jgi:predicted alpha/beta-hydrolase family hydrolase
MAPKGNSFVEHAARYEDVKIPLRDPVHGLSELSGVLGIPEWWPTGARIGVVLAHGAGSDMNNPLLVSVQKRLTDGGYLTIRFNFPFAEGKKKKPDEDLILEDAYSAALGILARDPTAAPAHVFVGGMQLGARIVANLSAARLRSDGVFLIGYPLHEAGKSDVVDARPLFRIIAPLLFIQGSKDKFCDLSALRKTLLRVGAPHSLFTLEEVDHRLIAPKKSGRPDEEIYAGLATKLEQWMSKILGNA